MFSSILVATDLSARSERALRRAFSLAEQHDAALTVLSIVDEDLPATSASRLKTEAEEELERICASISPRAATLRVEIADPTQAIVAATEDGGTDLLVMGTHRPRPVLDIFSGTTMERIVRAVSVPVLLVKDPVDHPYRFLLAGIDLSPSCAGALKAATALVPEARIETFHSFHVPYRGLISPTGSAETLRPFLKEANEALESWWAENDLSGICPRPEPEPVGRTQLLLERMKAQDPDLLVLGAHGRASFAPTLLGGFTEEILRNPPCDILIVRR